MSTGETLKGHLEMLLLAALRGRPSHGYALIQALRVRSGGAFDLPEGTVYPALHRLEQAGFIESRWQEEENRRRRIYRLTRKGLRSLDEKQRAWDRFVVGVQSTLEEAP